MKKGIRRIKTNSLRPVMHAQNVLDLLREALAECERAGACYTAARVRYAISSAHGAVRAASYREARILQKRKA